jgi:hypothetical protein
VGLAVGTEGELIVQMNDAREISMPGITRDMILDVAVGCFGLLVPTILLLTQSFYTKKIIFPFRIGPPSHFKPIHLHSADGQPFFISLQLFGLFWVFDP